MIGGDPTIVGGNYNRWKDMKQIAYTSFTYLKPHFEWIAWTIGLFLMATMDPYSAQSSLCLFEWIGIEWCPGHGLGHSIAFLARGEWKLAFQSHPLGPAAIAILLARAIKQGYIAFTYKI